MGRHYIKPAVADILTRPFAEDGRCEYTGRNRQEDLP